MTFPIANLANYITASTTNITNVFSATLAVRTSIFTTAATSITRYYARFPIKDKSCSTASITRITSFFTASTATMTTNLASTTTIITNYFAISIAFFTNMTIIKLRLNFSNVFIFFKGGKSAILLKLKLLMN